MKRKLSLLLAIVMILSLVPMAAFAAPSQYTTVAEIDTDSITADGSDEATITVYAYQADGTEETINAGNVANYLVVSSRSGVDTVGAAVYGTVDNKVEFGLTTTAPGDFKVAVALANAIGDQQTKIKNFLNGATTYSADQLGIVKTFNMASVAGTLDTIVDVTAATEYTGGTGIQADPYTGKKANGIESYELSFKVTTGNIPVKGQEVKFSTNKADASLNKTVATTDSAGRVKVKVSSLKPGTYSVKAVAGDESKTVYVTLGANGVYNLELVKGGNEVTAKDNDYKFEFKLLDVNGNKVSISGVNSATAAAIAGSATYGNLKLETVTEPDGAATDSKIYTNASTADYSFSSNTDGNLELTIKGKELDKEGDYKFKAYVDTGKFVEIPLTVKKQGTVVKITVDYKETGIALGEQTASPTVKRYDANNVSVTLDAAAKASDITFIANDVRKVQSIATDGKVTVATDSKYAGELTITVIDKENNLTASDNFKVGVQPSGLSLTADAKQLVGEDVKVAAQILDADGNAIALGQNYTAVEAKFYVVSKPAGAIVETSQPSTILSDMQKTGKADLTVASNVAGEVKIQVVIAATKAAAVTNFTQTVTLNIGTAPVVKPVVGAKSLVLNIGSTVGVADGAVKTMDVAPFIKDGRTFVPVRFIAEQLGAEVSFTQNAAGLTETVTLTKGDLVVTMTMGSKDIKVVNAGVTTTVAADVAAYVEAGRTVLPFRALAEAMGATVNYGMNADNTAVQWVSFEQK